MKYQNKAIYDYSCSETIMHAANDYYHLDLSENVFKMMAPFSGGMYEKDICGILSASIAVLGIIFTKDNSHNSPILKEATIDLRQAFYKEFGTISCVNLLETHRDPNSGCRNIIIKGGTILKNIVKKYQEIEKDNEVEV